MSQRVPLYFLLMFLLISSLCLAQEEIVYKKVDSTTLYLEIHRPEQLDSSKKYPAIVFFFGGGWIGGNRQHFIHHAKHYVQKGFICILADYRTKNEHGTSPFESLMDAKSAMRYVRFHASELNIDPDKIIASGGSAGGHLAAATAFITDYNEASDDLSISPAPNALILFNPVIDNGPGGYGYERIGDAYKNFSPLHNISKDAPPTILFLGTKDELVPVETAQYYQVVMQKGGSICELKLYEDQGHGFFNFQNSENYNQTLAEADQFLTEIGMLKE